MATKMNPNDLSNTVLKRIAVSALRSVYGFTPPKTDIILMEANGDGTYIGIEIHGHGYQIYCESVLFNGDKPPIPVAATINTIEW